MAEKEHAAAYHHKAETRQALVDTLLAAMPLEFEEYEIPAPTPVENESFEDRVAEDDATFEKELEAMDVEEEKVPPAPKHRGVHAGDVHKQHHTSTRLRPKQKIREEPVVETASIDAEKVKDFDAEKERLVELETHVSTDPRFLDLLTRALDYFQRSNRVLGPDEDAAKELETLEAKELKLNELIQWYESEGMDNEALEAILKHAFTTNEKGPVVQTKIDVIGVDEAPFAVAVEVVPKVHREKIHEWWRSPQHAVRDVFKETYWATRWNNPEDSVMNAHGALGVTVEEIQKRKEHSRQLYMVGVAGLMAPAHAAAPSHPESTVVTEAPQVIEESPIVVVEKPVPLEIIAPIETVARVETVAPVEAPVVETIPEPAPQPVVMPDYFTIPRGGETGIELFANIGLDQKTWERYQNTLVDQFHDDFFRLPSGNVGIMHSGSLSEPAKQFINSIPK